MDGLMLLIVLMSLPIVRGTMTPLLGAISVLIVDDEPHVLNSLLRLFRREPFSVFCADSGQKGLEMLADLNNVALIISDQRMPGMNGTEFLHKSQLVSPDSIRMLLTGFSDIQDTVAAMNEGGATRYIAKPWQNDELLQAVQDNVAIYRLRQENYHQHEVIKTQNEELQNWNSNLKEQVLIKTAQIHTQNTALEKALALSRKAEYEISFRLARAAEFRDQETGMHIRRISVLSKHLASLAGLPDEQCEMLYLASPLHDVGKIGIPDRILLKQGALDQCEFDIMNMHTTIGGGILSDAEHYPIINAASIIARQHHEKWDGSGYPSGIKDEEIHIFARIVSIVDVFDALCSERPYKKAFPLDKTINIMEEGRGTFFDPNLLDIFLSNTQEFGEIMEQLKG
jgi:putative two-component system response regulator